VPNGFNDSTLDEKQIKSWYSGRFKGYNIGVLCGVGYVCLDVDPKNAGIESFEELIVDNDPLPDTWVEDTGESKSGDRGRHYWFKVPNEMRGEQILTRKPLPGYLGVDLLASNQYAIVAPSLHVSGVQYDTVLDIDEASDCPSWLLDLTRTAKEDEFEIRTGEGHSLPTGIRPGPEVRRFLRTGDVPPGGQQPMVIKAARALWGLWVDLEDAIEMIWDALNKCEWGDEPWSRDQVSYHVAHTYNSAPKDIDIRADLPFTDWGNSLRLVQQARGNLRYCPHTKTWYHYDATCWREDYTGLVHRMVTAVSLKELQKAAFLEDPEKAQPIRKNATNLQGARTSNNVVSKAETAEQFIVNISDFDTDKYLLNCTNATIDLRSGEAHDQKREDLITRVARGAYYEDARSELWEETIDSALNGDEELISYLQLVLGQALFGITYEHAFYYLHGPGGTGKTTVLEAVAHALGSYAGVADPESFMQSPNATPGGTRADLAALRGRRFIISTEIQAHSKFSTATVNRLTGNDTITVRVPYAKAMLTFKPEWTIFFAANHFPSVSASRRDGFWRRVKVVPFEHQLDKKDMNPVLPHLLAQREHVEGILAWVIEGAVKWWDQYGSKKKTLTPPREVEEQTEHQQEESDPLLGFYSTLEYGDDLSCLKSELHEHYLGWADAQGIKMPWTRQKLSRHLKSNLGIDDKATGDNLWVWLGVRTKPPLKLKG
jgi:putative DNA primase/helicase